MTDNNLHKSCTAFLLVIKKDDDPNPARLIDGRHAPYGEMHCMHTKSLLLRRDIERESKRARRARPGLGAVTVS